MDLFTNEGFFVILVVTYVSSCVFMEALRHNVTLGAFRH